MQLLYPLEINCKCVEKQEESEVESNVQESTQAERPRRRAAIAGEQLTETLD